MPVSKKKDDPQVILQAALSIFAQKGFANTAMTDIAKAVGRPVAEIRKQFPTKEELLIAAFRTGQKKMETNLRQVIGGDLEDHIALMFDSILLGLMPFGPEIHLNLTLQATEDKVLMEIIKRSSRSVNFAVKAYLSQMVSLSIMEPVDEVEKVNDEMVASFIPCIAGVLEGKKLPDIKKAWVANVRKMLKTSSKTTVPASS
jgi:AcrR family transcriptional regulator